MDFSFAGNPKHRERNMNSKLITQFMLGAGLVALVTGLSGCATKQIEELESSVSQLEQQLTEYQIRSTQKTNQVDSSITQAMRTQEGLESMLQQIANRLSNLERESASFQQQLSRMETFSNDTATLAQNVQQDVVTMRQDFNALQSQVEALSSNLNELKSLTNTATTRNQRQIQDARRDLSARMDEMESSTREMYSRILKELGAEVPPAPETTSGNGETHVVQSGETLSKIASQYGVSIRALQELNGVEDPSLIVPGQQLRIP